MAGYSSSPLALSGGLTQQAGLSQFNTSEYPTTARKAPASTNLRSSVDTCLIAVSGDHYVKSAVLQGKCIIELYEKYLETFNSYTAITTKPARANVAMDNVTPLADSSAPAKKPCKTKTLNQSNWKWAASFCRQDSLYLLRITIIAPIRVTRILMNTHGRSANHNTIATSAPCHVPPGECPKKVYSSE